MNEKFEHLLLRAEQLITRIEAVLPQPLAVPDWTQAIAYRYRKRSTGHGTLEPVRHVGAVRLSDLQEIENEFRGRVEDGMKELEKNKDKIQAQKH